MFYLSLQHSVDSRDFFKVRRDVSPILCPQHYTHFLLPTSHLYLAIHCERLRNLQFSIAKSKLIIPLPPKLLISDDLGHINLAS